ncbi:MAG TPA: RNA polymerase sigma factor [Xanthobacteraceae bacterium]
MDLSRATTAIAAEQAGQDAFDNALARLRPKLHRYCARMIGSAVDAEDVVQEALLKAIEAFQAPAAIANVEAWLFRIAHNTALDFLRRQSRQQTLSADEDITMIADPIDEVHQRQAAAAGLYTFMRLSVSERSGVILMDVLGYSLEEIRDITGSSVPALKAALHRGRKRLRMAAAEPDNRPPPILSPEERAQLSAYMERFNSRDFDAIREMLAEDVRLDLVNKTRMEGSKEVGRYFSNYSSVCDWHLQLGFVDRRPALLVRDRDDSARRPMYFILLSWTGGRVATIRDFRYARYVTEAAEIVQ